VDAVFIFIFGVTIFFLVGVTLVMVYFAYRYNRKRHPQPQPSPSHNFLLEFIWTAIPTLIFVAMFYYSWSGYLALRQVPLDAIPVKAIGRMWTWTFEYENGKTSDKLVVPVGRAVKVEIISTDVLHSFYVPAFRVKRDAVPGMNTYAWFRAPGPGSYDIFCAEFCGVGHSSMISTVEAVTEAEFNQWYQEVKPVAVEDKAAGKDLLTRYGCLACHSLDGSKRIGPTFKGIYGRETVVIHQGREETITVDDGYLKRSIIQPQVDIVKGYPPVMQSFSDMPEKDIEDILGYLKTLE
jgi:cytochrome c oxidase subunit 2